MPHQPPDWKVGNAVYARYYDARTSRYFIKGHGRVLRVEGERLVIRTRSGVETVHSSVVYRSREEGEAGIAADPSPQSQAGPMAHHTVPAPAQVQPVDHECLRCERLLDGLEPLMPDHTPRCPYRGTGRDPEPKG